jgi:uncharacterized protein YjbI with pentapeptide repeats
MTNQRHKSKEEWIAIIQENQSSQRKLQISDCDLSGVNFEYCNLEGAELTRVNLTGASLTRINLQGSKLYDVDFTNANLDGALFTNSEIKNCNFYNARINGTRFSGSNNENSSFQSSKSENAQFDGCVLNNIDMFDAILKGASFRHAKFIDVNLKNTQIEGSDFDSAQIDTKLLIGKNLNRCKFAFLNFEGCDLRETKLNDTYWVNAYLNGVNMSNLELDWVDFSYADLSNAKLEGLKINAGELEHTNLTGADLTNALFLNLRSVDGINFDNAKLDGFIMTEFDYTNYYKNLPRQIDDTENHEYDSLNETEIHTSSNTIDIPTYCLEYPEIQHDENLDEAIFICPYSNTNIFKWEYDGFPDIPELVIYINNLADSVEDAYVNKTLLPIKNEFLNNTKKSSKYNFEDYITNQIDPNQPYYRLILQHPDGERTDYVTVIYKGEYRKLP